MSIDRKSPKHTDNKSLKRRDVLIGTVGLSALGLIHATSAFSEGKAEYYLHPGR